MELDLVIVFIALILIGWLIYHYFVRSDYANLAFQPTNFHKTVLSRCKHIHSKYSGSPWVRNAILFIFRFNYPKELYIRNITGA